MSEHQHKHHHHADPEHPKTGLRKHATWITIVGVALMLAAILMYVFSNDEMVQPGKPVGNPVPIAAP